MKRKFLSLSVVFSLMLSLSLFVFSASAASNALVQDYTGNLTSAEISNLNNKASSVSSEYGCNVSVILVQNTEGYEIDYYAELILDSQNLGYGQDDSIVMLLISLDDREFTIYAYGYGNTVFTDYGKEKLEEEFLPDLSDGNYYNSFNAYINACENYLKLASGGTPVDVNNNASGSSFGIFKNIIIPIAIALIFCMGSLSKMKTAAPQRSAHNYIPASGLNLITKQDNFINRTETREEIKKSSSSSSSGGTTVNSRGGSSRKGRF